MCTKDISCQLIYIEPMLAFILQTGNDELRRSPGTPVFTAPECCLGYNFFQACKILCLVKPIKAHILIAVLAVDCWCYLGLTYHGKASDTWAVGVTLYCMILGEYPFLGDTLQDTYDRVIYILTSHPLILLHKHIVTYFQPILKKYKLCVFLLFQIVNNPIEIPDDINPQLKN
jgi:[calcium/calmodulin-dependent protein kinase] kinase